jgi:hypothetical protein
VYIQKNIGNVIAKTFVITIALFITLIPMWFSVLVWWMLAPDDLWQKLATVAVLLLLLGKVQKWLLVLGSSFIIEVLTKEL